ncbi:hypothetical protein Nepgr_032205 [Nepenthes gracilis]|uniref:Uncharacterized protein n=1 Tax=Nepenthes gracilis TaxID=150966 RepID=A0AAD3TKE5_NEPGR|nr:hypothetical protein Nepgr_032205 [Nepenthes gracilis]
MADASASDDLCGSWKVAAYDLEDSLPMMMLNCRNEWILLLYCSSALHYLLPGIADATGARPAEKDVWPRNLLDMFLDNAVWTIAVNCTGPFTVVQFGCWIFLPGIICRTADCILKFSACIEWRWILLALHL